MFSNIPNQNQYQASQFNPGSMFNSYALSSNQPSYMNGMTPFTQSYAPSYNQMTQGGGFPQQQPKMHQQSNVNQTTQDTSNSNSELDHLKEKVKEKRINSLANELLKGIAPLLEGLRSQICETVETQTQQSIESSTQYSELSSDVQESLKTFQKSITKDLQKLVQKSQADFKKTQKAEQKAFYDKQKDDNLKIEKELKIMNECIEGYEQVSIDIKMFRNQISSIVREEFTNMKEEMERQKGFEEPGQYYKMLSKKKVNDTKKKIQRKVEKISKKKKTGLLYRSKENRKKGAPIKIYNNRKAATPYNWDFLNTKNSQAGN